VANFRLAGHQHYLTFGLLTRAWSYAIAGKRGLAQCDLDEAWEIAERGRCVCTWPNSSLSRAVVLCGEALSVE